ncbi:MAG: glycosyltransferase family 9 protein, partial [Planctomycetota bacterium]
QNIGRGGSPPRAPGLSTSPPPARVLVARSSHLGDVAQTIPLVHALRSAFPGARVAWAIQPAFAPLVAPLVDAVVPFERDGGARAWPRIRRAMRAFGADLAVDAQGNWKSAMVVRLSGAQRRVGCARAAWQEPLAARVLGVSGATAADAPHLVDRLMAVAASVGAPAAPPRLDPALTGDELRAGFEALEALSPGAGRAPLLLHPGVPGDPRTWPSERYAALLERFGPHSDRAPIVVTGPAEADVGARLDALDRCGAAAHLVGQSDVRALCALFHAARQRGGVLVAQDSGPAHLAASVGLGVRLLAGPEDPSRTGPWPVCGAVDSPHRLVRPPADWRPGAPWTRRPIESIEPEDVLAAL